MATGEVYGAEALIRWQHPERGLLAPGAFLSFIEGSNLEVAFGQWVIKHTLRQAAIWQHQGLQLVISLNISANHLLTEDFCRYLQQELAENPNLDPRSIELEVLESTAISDIGLASAMIKRCQSLGFGFALDDFGTGYSSLTYLRQLPIQTIKIDQSFVRDMLIDPDDLKIIEGVIQLALVFDRQVVAEGVETLEHGKQLLALGCQLAQGYGVAKPLPAAQLPAWIANWSKQSDWQALTVA
jgi:EAL domain-containing protein (putative c-di-GMP-specific phosphodiesterase class I)